MNIGILGGGQLGRMLAMAGLPLGCHFTFLESAQPACAADVGRQIRLAYDDPSGLDELCRDCEVITYEFENVPEAVAERIALSRPIYPGSEALRVAQDRLVEKRCFESLDISVTGFAPIDSRGDLLAAVERLGVPAILKTRRMGYDGKGQYRLQERNQVDDALKTLGAKDLIYEAFVDFKREISCLGVRSKDGEMAFYPVAENRHRNGILRVSCPHPNDPMQQRAEDYTRRVLEKLDYVGVLGFEFFDIGDDLLANEIAPRVHNSGHWSIEGSECSQFENHIRAITGMSLGSTALRQPCAMVNFIGSAPPVEALAKFPGLHIHLYGKSPRPGRKIGHATLTADSDEELSARIEALEQILPTGG